MPNESAIILPVPEAEGAVGQLRRLHDPLASYGVPAHISLLYPFAPPSKVGVMVEALTSLFSLVPAFGFSLIEVRCFPATAYLHPEPSARLVHLIESLRQRWPEYPPYRGAFTTVIPHLTVADRVAADVLDAIVRSVPVHLPLSCRAAEAWLICSDERGFWSRREVFPLGRA